MLFELPDACRAVLLLLRREHPFDPSSEIVERRLLADAIHEAAEAIQNILGELGAVFSVAAPDAVTPDYYLAGGRAEQTD